HRTHLAPGMAVGEYPHRFGLPETFHERQSEPVPPVDQGWWRGRRRDQAILDLVQSEPGENQLAHALSILVKCLLQRGLATEAGGNRLTQLFPDPRRTEEHVRPGTRQIGRQGVQPLIETDLTTALQRGKLHDL